MSEEETNTVPLLKNKLWSQLDELLNGEETRNDPTDTDLIAQINTGILEYESTIEMELTSFNQCHRDLTLSWERAVDRNRPDKLTLLSSSNDQTIDTTLSHEYSEILSNINWIQGFRAQLRKSTISHHDHKLDTIDKLRDDTIESHIHNEKTSDDTHTYKMTNRHSTARDQLLNKTQQVTSNLIKSNTLLQSTILQSDLNLDDLKQQTHSLAQVQDKYSQFEVVFDKTSKLVKSLEKASNQEKRDVYLSLGFLLLAVSWVIWRRIFKGPTKLFLWILFKFFKGILASCGLVKSTLSSSNSGVTTPESSIISTTISTTISSLTDNTAISQAVEDAMERIMSHDEL